MEKQMICIDATPTYLHAPMHITKGLMYRVRLCPETGTVQVMNPDPEARHVIRTTGRGDQRTFELTGVVEFSARPPIRYLAERFQLI